MHKGSGKDDFLSKVAKAYMAIIGDGKGGIFCEDSLKKLKNGKQQHNNKSGLRNSMYY